MRVVRNQEDFAEAFDRATSEAKSAFGDGACFVERYLNKPRHIEVQLLGDSVGNVVHLFERDCSVQRRYQKVVEQAPAPNLNEEVRRKILEDAKKLASAVGYRNAGSECFCATYPAHIADPVIAAEFLVDDQDRHVGDPETYTVCCTLTKCEQAFIEINRKR